MKRFFFRPFQAALNLTGSFLYAAFYTHRKTALASAALLAFLYWRSLPHPLFQDPTSAVLEDRRGELLSARIAADGQWRFPHNDAVPNKFKTALITFEDERFYYHRGVDAWGMGRAIWQNLSHGEVVSGGSTISMQVIRMARKGQSRNMWNKLAEAVLATRLEWSYSKEEILAMYASNAPFGGNVVGLDAAAWRYYGRSADQLSWSEAATLAVLPNAPGLVHPGKNRKTLEDKRNRLLDKLLEKGIVTQDDLQLAKAEPLPGAPVPLPNLAPHLMDRVTAREFRKEGATTRLRTSLDRELQERAAELVKRHVRTQESNGIHNAAVVVLHVSSGEALAYIGNTPDGSDDHGADVDCVMAPRSTGSILKPFLYASMLNEGTLLPDMLVADIPTYYGVYSPKNYEHTYDGAVPASEALARSLNVPSIRMLSSYGQPVFYSKLQHIGMTTLSQPAHHYGLSLVLGGAEAELWDLAGMYAGMARTVNQFHEFNGRYEEDVFRAAQYVMADTSVKKQLTEEAPLGAAACYQTLNAMTEVLRPGEDAKWKEFSSSRRIAWKTGTSYGFRDAWAIGCTPEYVVAVWVGNADGEGRPGLIGSQAAAPLMFDLFNALPPQGGWFHAPLDDMRQAELCRVSGHRASQLCPDRDTVWIAAAGQSTLPCPYHQNVHLDANGSYRVHGDCYPPGNMVHRVWFVLPPAQEAFYQRRNAEYRELPTWAESCVSQAEGLSMEMIYPRSKTKIFVPVNLDGSSSKTIFEVTHRDPVSRIFWHLDSEYIGTTESLHQMALDPVPGLHTLTLVDESGQQLQQQFEVVGE